MLSTTAIAFYSAFAGGAYAGALRGETFGEKSEFAKSEAAKELKKLHEKELPNVKFSPGGYPDMGHGLYAHKLPYAAWYKFASGQRAHYNLVENLPMVLTLHALAGVYFPRAAAINALVWIGARHIWSQNYIKRGPENRYDGIAVLHQLSTVGWLGMAIAGGLKLSGLISTSAF